MHTAPLIIQRPDGYPICIHKRSILMQFRKPTAMRPFSFPQCWRSLEVGNTIQLLSVHPRIT